MSDYVVVTVVQEGNAGVAVKFKVGNIAGLKRGGTLKIPEDAEVSPYTLKRNQDLSKKLRDTEVKISRAYKSREDGSSYMVHIYLPLVNSEKGEEA